MAEKFTGQRCQDCQGNLVYNKKEKYWECPYCGKIYERQLRFDKVQIDGLAGINDLVRSTLSKLLLLNFKGAEKDLLDCEKINHANAGTLIAGISVSLFKSFYIKDRQQELTRANNLLQRLNREFPDIDEPEQILYDFIDSANIYGLLYTVYSMTNQTARKNAVFELLDCGEIYSSDVIRLLLSALLKDRQYASADILVDKIDGSNCRVCLSTILTGYPACAKKVAHVEKVLSKTDPETDLSGVLNSYFSSTKDSSNVVIEVFLSAMSHKFNFDTTAVIHSALRDCTSVENATRIFKAISAQRLDTETANTVLLWCINDCSDCAISEIGFTTLFETNSVFGIDDHEVISLLHSGRSEEEKIQKFAQILNIFKLTNKSMDRILSYHLCQNAGSYKYRRAIFDEILCRVASVSLSIVESYTLTVTLDGSNKYLFLQDIFAKSSSVSMGGNIFSQYLKKAVDTPPVRDQNIFTLLSMNVLPDPEAVSAYLLNQDELHSDRVLDLMIDQSCKATSSTFDRYLCSLGDRALFNPKIAKIATQFGYTLSPHGYSIYLLNVEEAESAKIGKAQQYYQVCAEGVKAMSLGTSVNGVEIVGNIAQIYLLKSNDDMYVMQEILKALRNYKIKLDVPIEIVATRKKMKLRKFIGSNAAHLNIKVETLAQQLL